MSDKIITIILLAWMSAAMTGSLVIRILEARREHMRKISALTNKKRLS